MMSESWQLMSASITLLEKANREIERQLEHDDESKEGLFAYGYNRDMLLWKKYTVEEGTVYKIERGMNKKKDDVRQGAEISGIIWSRCSSCDDYKPEDITELKVGERREIVGGRCVNNSSRKKKYQIRQVGFHH